ncbi:MAG: hypothetical protein ACR2H1_14785 [Limisphaerales bacterium]
MGRVIGSRSLIYPNTNWRDLLPANMIVKNKAARKIVERHLRGT